TCQICAEAARKIDRRVDTATVDKAAVRAIATKVIADDLTFRIDGRGDGLRCARHIQNGVVAIAIKEAVGIPLRNFSIGSDDLPLVVDAGWISEIAVGRIDCSVDTMVVEEALLAGIIRKVKSDNLACSVYTVGY